jgi:tetratricopeptide (TPR) repeat protein
MQATQERPDDADVWLGASDICLCASMDDDALRCYEEYLRLSHAPDPAGLRARYLHTIIDMAASTLFSPSEISKSRAAIEGHLETFRNLCPQTGDLPDDGGQLAPELELREEFAACPSNIDPLLTLADRYAATERIVASAACALKALGVAPQSAEAHVAVANALYKLRLLDESLEHARDAVRLDPTHTGGPIAEGNVHFDREDFETAAECYRRAAEVNPELAGAWYNLGNTLAAMGRHDQALECHEKALAISPDSADAWGAKACACMHCGLPDEALRCAVRGTEVDPTDARLWALRVQILRDLGRDDEADEAYEQGEDATGEF